MKSSKINKLHKRQGIYNQIIEEISEETSEQTIVLITLRGEVITTKLTNHSTVQTTDLIDSRINSRDLEASGQGTNTIDPIDFPIGITISNPTDFNNATTIQPPKSQIPTQLN